MKKWLSLLYFPWVWFLFWGHNLIAGPYREMYSFEKPWFVGFPLFLTTALLLAIGAGWALSNFMEN